jgi:ATP-dependent DNA ligase
MQSVDTTAFSLTALRARLQEMTEAELLQFGKAARVTCSREANWHEPPREVFVVQLKEARAEWRRRHPKEQK